MFVKSLKISNFRNHTNSYFDFKEETLITGMNGSGKTSVLESIFVLFGLRSFKKQPFLSLITFGSDFFRIEADILNNDLESSVVFLYKGKRICSVNGEEIEDISSYIYNYPVACYTPDYQGILSKEQQERRNFIDRFIFYTDKQYIEYLKVYNRLIQQKNTELDKDITDWKYIEVIDEKIIELSEKIYNMRKSFIKEINTSLDNIYNNLDFDMEKIHIKYTSNILDKSILNKEKVMKRSLYGIHRDKIEMEGSGKIIEKFSSTGQKKTFVLLTLYSFINYVEKIRQIKILTLLDDFDAALDMRRSKFIRDIYSSGGRQVLYTSTDNIKSELKNVIELN